MHHCGGFSRLTSHISRSGPAEEELLKGHANLRQILPQKTEINRVVEKDGKTKLGQEGQKF